MNSSAAAITSPPPSRTACGGLFKRQEKWALTWRGRLLLLGLLALLVLSSIRFALPFLAVNDRVDTDLLVVEGWIPNFALEESIAEFKSKSYGRMFVVGCEIINGAGVEEGDSQAEYATKRLKSLGMDMGAVQPVTAHIKYRNRTYQSAVALRNWIQENKLPVKGINVVTLGPHARRSRLLFQEAFKNKVKVGIIAVPDREYDQKYWWKFSEGVREVLSEGIAYFYVRFFFYPSN